MEGTDFNALIDAEVNRRMAEKLREIADSLNGSASAHKAWATMNTRKAVASIEPKKAQSVQRGAAGRTCGQCGKPIHALSKKNWCKACLQANQPQTERRLCTVCQTPLRSDNKTGKCSNTAKCAQRKLAALEKSALPVSA